MNINDSNIRPELTFRRLVYLHMQQLTNFPYIEQDFDALTDYELLCLVVKYLNDVIDNSNEQNTSITNLYNAFLQLQTYMNNSVQELEDEWNNKTSELENAWTDKTTELENEWNDKTTELETAFNNLQTWINNYFDNLDVQNEIDNKLDEMLQDGVLEQIIEQFIQSAAVWCFDNVADMKVATNLVNGSYTRTLGYRSLNDGGSAIYKIRTKTNEDITNEMNLIALNDTTLVAELIIENNIINIKQFGAYGDGTHDDYNVLNVAFNNYKNIYIPNGTYLSNSLISVSNNNLYIKGENNSILKYPTEASSEITNNQCFITFNNSDYIKIENIKIDCGGTYIVRPYLWETSDYNTYRTKRYLTYNGIKTNNCDYTIIENIEIYNCCVGIMSNDSCFQTFNNIFIHDTFADGIRIGTGCENSNITNCLFNNLGDDCVAITHENGNVTEDYKPKNIIVDNINGKDCFGAIITILSAENCHCYNSILIDNKDFPIKLGSSNQSYVSENCSIENVNVITSKRVEGLTYDSEANNIAHGIVSISGSLEHEQNNCILKDCIFESSNGDNKLYRIDGSGYIIDGCQFIGYACRTYSLSNLKMYNCVFKGNDGSTFNNITNSVIENCDFYNNETYSWNTTRGLGIFENENCIYKNVYAEGTSAADNHAISLFTGTNKGNIFFSSKYNLQPAITNVTNIYSDGVLIFTLDAFYSATTFKIGQQVYWTNQDKLYVRKSTGLVEL